MLSEEELGNKLYVAMLGQGEYAARVHSARSYDAVSRDILQVSGRTQGLVGKRCEGMRAWGAASHPHDAEW